MSFPKQNGRGGSHTGQMLANLCLETIYDHKTYISLDFVGLKVGPELQKHITNETAVLL